MHRYILYLSLLLVLFFTSRLSAEQAQLDETVSNNLKILIETNACPGCDLSGVNLNRVDLSRANLEGANLFRAKLYLANLSNANLRNANLREAGFGGSDLAGADFRGADLRRTAFAGAYLAGAKFDGKFISSRLSTGEGMPVIEEKIYVEDSVKSKQLPERQDVKIRGRRDFEEPPPAIPPPLVSSQVDKDIADIEQDASKVTEVIPESSMALTEKEPVQEEMLAKHLTLADNPEQNDFIQEIKAPPVKKIASIQAVRIVQSRKAPVVQQDSLERKNISTHSVKAVSPSLATKIEPDKNKIVELNRSYKVRPGEVNSILKNEQKTVPVLRNVNKKSLMTATKTPAQALESESSEIIINTLQNKKFAKHIGVEKQKVKKTKIQKDEVIIVTTEAVKMNREIQQPFHTAQADDTEAKPEEKRTKKSGEDLLKKKKTPVISMVKIEPPAGAVTVPTLETKPIQLSAEEVKAPVLSIEAKKNFDILLVKKRCYGCNLQEVDLSGQDLAGADLEGADLSGSKLNNADLSKANLQGALLLHTLMKNTDLRGADLYKADLTGADLTGARVDNASFEGAELSGVRGLTVDR